MVSMLVSNSQLLHCFYVEQNFEDFKKTKYRKKKNENNTNFWKSVVQVWDDATRKMLL